MACHSQEATCLTTGCTGVFGGSNKLTRDIGGRGMCRKCYHKAYMMVVTGKTSWSELERLGLAKSSRVKNGKHNVEVALTHMRSANQQKLVKVPTQTYSVDIGQLHCDECGVTIGDSYIKVDDVGLRPSDIKEEHYIADTWLACSEPCASKLIAHNTI